MDKVCEGAMVHFARQESSKLGHVDSSAKNGKVDVQKELEQVEGRRLEWSSWQRQDFGLWCFESAICQWRVALLWLCGSTAFLGLSRSVLAMLLTRARLTVRSIQKASLPTILHRRQGRCVSQPRWDFLQGSQAEDTLNLTPIRLMLI